MISLTMPYWTVELAGADVCDDGKACGNGSCAGADDCATAEGPYICSMYGNSIRPIGLVAMFVVRKAGKQREAARVRVDEVRGHRDNVAGDAVSNEELRHGVGKGVAVVVEQVVRAETELRLDFEQVRLKQVQRNFRLPEVDDARGGSKGRRCLLSVGTFLCVLCAYGSRTGCARSMPPPEKKNSVP